MALTTQNNAQNRATKPYKHKIPSPTKAHAQYECYLQANEKEELTPELPKYFPDDLIHLAEKEIVCLDPNALKKRIYSLCQLFINLEKSEEVITRIESSEAKNTLENLPFHECTHTVCDEMAESKTAE